MEETVKEKQVKDLTTEEKIEMANDLVEFATKRGRELIYARHRVPSDLYKHASNVGFDSGLVELTFEQVHRYADDTYSVQLSSVQLCMSEENWAKHVEENRMERIQKEQQEKERRENEVKEQELRQLNYLKTKHGL